jgi:hypothetical protein
MLQDCTEFRSLDVPYQTHFYAPPNIPIWVLNNVWPPFLLENLPQTDSAPLADYLPYLNLLRELLREHADQILPHPITISVKPGDLVLLKGSSTLSIGTSVDQPSSGHSHHTHCCQDQWDPQWQHLSRNN